MRVRQQATAKTVTTPAPIGGLNARDALAAMPPNDAITLDNFFPTPTSVDLRKGYTNWVTGFPAAVESLMPYKSATTGKLFAAAGTAFYDATSTGVVGAAVVSGLTNARWQSANIGTPGGQFLYCVNGVNDAQLYNGVTWQAVNPASAPISITGVSTSSLVHVNVYKQRLFFVEKNSFKIWYLPLNSVGGAATAFDLSSKFKLGGYLMAMATWSLDNADGVSEYAVFISSEGEIALYEGSDPSTADSWSQQGMFRVGAPIGRRCFERVGSDLLLLCADGFMPLSKALLTDRSQAAAISGKIVNLVNADAQRYATNFGWEACLYPVGNKLLINVPATPGKRQYQYVMNTITGAWCRFTGWNANTFATLGNDLYFGSNLGVGANSAFVAKADVGYSDNGAYISGEAKTAFQYFGSPGSQKQITMCRPTFLTAGSMQAALAVDVNFEDRYPTAQPTFSGTTGTPWGTKVWNTFPWGDVSSIKNDWQDVSGIGYCAALHMRIVNNRSAVQWQSVDYVYKLGGVL